MWTSETGQPFHFTVEEFSRRTTHTILPEAGLLLRINRRFQSCLQGEFRLGPNQ